MKAAKEEPKRTRNKKKRSENLSKRDLAELMGQFDQVYERHNHAVRRKGR